MSHGTHDDRDDREDRVEPAHRQPCEADEISVADQVREDDDDRNDRDDRDEVMVWPRLVVDRVRVERFGGLAARVVDLPAAPFVVLSGDNETGKSTLAELVAWLLVGPGGSASDAQRYGDVGAHIGGRLAGRLSGRSFESTGSFKVPAKGAPNAAGFRVTLDTGPDLDLDQWRARLGGVDAAVFSSIHRVEGEQLHEGDGVEAHLSQVALAGVAGRVDPRRLVVELTDRVGRLTTSQAKGAETVARVGATAAAIRRDIDEAGTTARDHARLRTEREQADVGRRGAQQQRDELRAQRSVAQTVLDADEVAQEVARLRRLQAEGPVVPPAWEPLAADPAALAAAVSAADEAEGQLAVASRTLERAAGELGCTVEQLEQVVLDDGSLAEVVRLAEVLRSADARLVEARGQVVEAESAAQRSTERVDRELARCGVDRSAVAAAQLDGAARGALRAAIERWSQRSEELAAERRRADGARRAADEAVALHRLETEAWEGRDTGLSAAAWLQRGAAPAPHPGEPSRPFATAMLLPGLLLAVAVVAGVLGEWRSAAAVVVVAVVALVLQRAPSRSTTDGAGPGGGQGAGNGAGQGVEQEQGAGQGRGQGAGQGGEQGVGQGADQELGRDADIGGVRSTFEAARRVLDAEAAERQRRGDLAAVEAAVREQASAVDAAREAYQRTAAAVRLPEAPTPAAALVTLETWSAAAELIGQDDLARDALATEQRRCDAAATAVVTAEAAIRDAARRAGLGDLAAVRTIEAVAPRHRSASALARDVARLRAEFADRRAEVERLLAPVAAEVGGWRWGRIVERAEELHQLARERDGIAAQLQARSTELELRLGEDPAVRELFAATPGRSALTAAIDDLGRAAEAAEREVQRCSELVGALDARLLELERSDRIVELSADLGTALERRSELAVEAGAHALAAALLAAVTEEHERAHQPAIVGRADQLARSVAPSWERVMVRAGGEGRRLGVEVHQGGGVRVAASRLSTGARALLYLSFRIALADHDAARRGVRLPLVCDDPMVHVDDRRIDQVAQLLRAAADSGHQVLLFTCQERTVEAACRAGAVHLPLDLGAGAVQSSLGLGAGAVQPPLGLRADTDHRPLGLGADGLPGPDPVARLLHHRS